MTNERRLRIGFDAHRRDRGPQSGQTVIRGLLAGFASLATSHELIAIRTADQPESSFDVPSIVVRRLPTTVATNALAVSWATRDADLDAIICQGSPPLRSNAVRIAFVHDALNRDYPQFFRRRERAYYRIRDRLVKRADWVVTGSESEHARLIRLGLARQDRSGVVPYGVSARFFSGISVDELATVRAKFGLPCNYVLYVGRLNTRKNLANLLRATAIADCFKRGTRLVVAGEADGQSRELARSLRASEQAMTIGFVPDEDLPALYRMADAFAFVSFGEGFGLPPLEAMATGCPVVVSNRPAMPEICGPAAITVDPTDPASIATGLDRAVRQGRRELSDVGRARASTYTWTRAAKALLEQVETAVDQESRPRNLDARERRSSSDR